MQVLEILKRGSVSRPESVSPEHYSAFRGTNRAQPLFPKTVLQCRISPK